MPFLQTDRADLVISSLGKNKGRAKIIDFSQPYAPFFSGVYGISEVADRVIFLADGVLVEDTTPD